MWDVTMAICESGLSHPPSSSVLHGCGPQRVLWTWVGYQLTSGISFTGLVSDWWKITGHRNFVQQVDQLGGAGISLED